MKKEEFSDMQLGLTGEYDYKGPYLYVDGENDGVLRIRIACAAFALLIAAAYVVAGLSGAEGVLRIYVMIPYIALAIPLCFIIAGLFYAIPFARKMTPLQHKRGFGRMKKASWYALGLEILTELIEIGFTAIVCKKGERSGEMLFIGCIMLAIVLTTVFISFQKRIPLRSTDEKTEEEDGNEAG